MLQSIFYLNISFRIQISRFKTKSNITWLMKFERFEQNIQFRLKFCPESESIFILNVFARTAKKRFFDKHILFNSLHFNAYTLKSLSQTERLDQLVQHIKHHRRKVPLGARLICSAKQQTSRSILSFKPTEAN